MKEQAKSTPLLSACLKCGEKTLGVKAIICKECVTELFKNSEQPVVFCKKCKRFHEMELEEKARAEKAIGVELNSMKDKKIILVLDSCPDCYIPGDSQEGQFAALTPVPEA